MNAAALCLTLFLFSFAGAVFAGWWLVMFPGWLVGFIAASLSGFAIYTGVAFTEMVTTD